MALNKLSIYEKMLTIRMFEEKALELYSKNLILGSIHTYIGQEAIAVGVCSNLDSKNGDCITSTHRGHGHVIAMNGDINALMAELLGKCNNPFCPQPSAEIFVKSAGRRAQTAKW